jgi:hypothetical protein
LLIIRTISRLEIWEKGYGGDNLERIFETKQTYDLECMIIRGEFCWECDGLMRGCVQVLNCNVAQSPFQAELNS